MAINEITHLLGYGERLMINDRGVGVGHREDHRDPAGEGSRCARGEVLLVRGAGLAGVHVDVDEAGQLQHPARGHAVRVGVHPWRLTPEFADGLEEYTVSAIVYYAVMMLYRTDYANELNYYLSLETYRPSNQGEFNISPRSRDTMPKSVLSRYKSCYYASEDDNTKYTNVVFGTYVDQELRAFHISYERHGVINGESPRAIAMSHEVRDSPCASIPHRQVDHQVEVFL